MGYLILLLGIALLMIVGYLRAKKEKMRELEEKMKKQIMPSGDLVPSDCELLMMTDEDYALYTEVTLEWLINYVGYKSTEAPDDEKKEWHNLFARLTRVRNQKRWQRKNA